jgi:hypothetical protein
MTGLNILLFYLGLARDAAQKPEHALGIAGLNLLFSWDWQEL